jgi:hypothetical protein
MKIRHLFNKIAGLILGSILLLGVGVGSNTIGHAQDRNGNGDQNRRDRNWDRYGNYGGSPEMRQTALNSGYNEGVREGSDDRRSGRQSSYRDSNAYRKATKDYNSRLGDRELYRRYFREAFESGYNAESNGRGNIGRDDRGTNRDRNDSGNRNRDDANRDRDNGDRNRDNRNSDGYGNFGGSFQLRQTALNAGFNEGTKQGRKDRNKRNGDGFQGQSAYQKGTKDYSSRLGDRELYRRYFREAYEHGYKDGVNGY